MRVLRVPFLRLQLASLEIFSTYYFNTGPGANAFILSLFSLPSISSLTDSGRYLAINLGELWQPHPVTFWDATSRPPRSCLDENYVCEKWIC